MAKERGTTSLWLDKEKYKLFASTCKRFDFQISEILESFFDEFNVRYPLEDPHEIKYIQAPAYSSKRRNTPHVREDYAHGLLKWLDIFKCPQCGKSKHFTKAYMDHLEKNGLVPQCHECHVSMELEEAPKKCP